MSQAADPTVQLKRAYEAPAAADGVRVLVDRLWARGISKDAAALDAWTAELGPSDALRSWFGHQPDRWERFAEKYRDELATPLRQTLLAALQGVAARSTLTLVYGARDTQENEAVVLRHYLREKRSRPPDTWAAATTLLVLAAAVAAARHDAVATAAGVRLFATPVLTADELDDALKELLTSGQLREVAGGWSLATRARQQVRQLGHPRPTTSAPP